MTKYNFKEYSWLSSEWLDIALVIDGIMRFAFYLYVMYCFFHFVNKYW